VHHDLEAKRGAWVQVARGAVDLDSYSLKAGDGAAISHEEGVSLTASEPADVLVFDLPAVNGHGS
jgi:redox-sensitive bicupin YhaK (pirin superfamily)